MSCDVGYKVQKSTAQVWVFIVMKPGDIGGVHPHPSPSAGRPTVSAVDHHPFASIIPGSPANSDGGDRKVHGAPPLAGQIRIILGKVATTWANRPAYERRAIVFVVVFMLLVVLSVSRALDSTAPGVAGQIGVLPQVGTVLRHGGILIADVNQYAVTAVADNDGSSIGPTQPPRAASSSTSADQYGTTPSTAIVTGKLVYDSQHQTWQLEWSAAVQWIGALFAVNGRGMELSTLQYWREGRLFSCDDRTGIVYEITTQEGAKPQAVPRFILADGNGNVGRGMRCEWSTVKGEYLLFGSTGKPRTDVKSNLVINQDALWVKSISPLGEIRHLDWHDQYEKLRTSLGIFKGNGYVVHECGVWSRVRREWLFVPRHVSSSPYDPADERRHGSTVMIIVDVNFRAPRVVALPPTKSSSTPFGVTECKFVPNGRDDLVVIVKALLRDDGTFQSVMAIVSVDGRLVMDDAAMPPGFKFEALELRPMLHSE